MNLNIFFTVILSSLLMILFLFKPLEIKQRKFTDVPLFNILSFTMYELSDKGLATLMSGTEATRFSDRYTVSNIDYTDNSQQYIANMKASSGTYEGDMVTLNGDVIYFREDGLTFETQSVVYNKKTSVASTNEEYVLHRGSDRVVGKKLAYNNLAKQIESSDVKAIYQLKERDK